MQLDESQPPIYDRPIGLRLLFTDPVSGAEHYVVRYPAGLRAQHHRHSASQTILVLEGRMVVDGQVLGPGAYRHIPAGQVMHHAPVDGAACLFLTTFGGPFDVEPVALR